MRRNKICFLRRKNKHTHIVKLILKDLYSCFLFHRNIFVSMNGAGRRAQLLPAGFGPGLGRSSSAISCPFFRVLFIAEMHLTLPAIDVHLADAHFLDVCTCMEENCGKQLSPLPRYFPGAGCRWRCCWQWQQPRVGVRRVDELHKPREREKPLGKVFLIADVLTRTVTATMMD